MFLWAIAFLIIGVASAWTMGYIMGADNSGPDSMGVFFVILFVLFTLLGSHSLLETGKERQKETVLRYLVSNDKVELRVDTKSNEYIYTLKDSSLVDLFNHLMEE